MFEAIDSSFPLFFDCSTFHLEFLKSILITSEDCCMLHSVFTGNVVVHPPIIVVLSNTDGFVV